MTNGATPLTTAEQERIVGMGRAGKTVRAIMEATGRSKGSVAGILHRNHVVLQQTRGAVTHRVLSSPRWKRALGAEKAALSRWDVDSVAYGNGEPHVERRPITLHRLAFERDEVITTCPYCNLKFC
jgi:hypothetical protein